MSTVPQEGAQKLVTLSSEKVNWWIGRYKLGKVVWLVGKLKGVGPVEGIGIWVG